MTQDFMVSFNCLCHTKDELYFGNFVTLLEAGKGEEHSNSFIPCTGETFVNYLNFIPNYPLLI
jgi:hypothetical protein